MESISVKDCLPEEGVIVLIYRNYGFESGEIQEDYLICLDCENIWAKTIHYDCEKVTHWMPLPPPPFLEQ